MLFFSADRYNLTKVAERDRQSRFPLMPMDEAVSTVLKYASDCGSKTVDNIQGKDVSMKI